MSTGFNPCLVVGPVGPPGPPGPRQIFIQQTMPEQGSSDWYWIETDALGALTGNEWAYNAEDD